MLVDQMQLTFPSGFAVANILRALTDENLLKHSIAKLGGGMGIGYLVGVFSLNISWFARFGFSSSVLAILEKASISASTFGAGMIVGARIAIPALVVGLIGLWQTPYLVSVGWLGPNDPFRSRPGCKKFATGSRTGRITDFLLDAVLLSSPYASSFGGFLELPTILWLDRRRRWGITVQRAYHEA
jgi:hypothetical protein